MVRVTLIYATALCLLTMVTAHQVQPGAEDILLLMGGVFGLSRILSRERIGQPIRDLLKGTMLGELVACSRCVGAWVCLVLLGVYEADREVGRVVAVVFTLAGVNMLLQALMAMVCAAVNLLESKASDRGDT